MTFLENFESFKKKLRNFSKINANGFDNSQVLFEVRNFLTEYSDAILKYKQERIGAKIVNIYQSDDLKDLEVLENLIISFEQGNKYEKARVIQRLLEETERFENFII